ncbi:hypothetical protein Y032_0420g1144 [Ancylostoma ceylanicum]|uniref:Uncharacterized protein n=1 Tax=Ancylostoma ceylanicum TaxID=53326 RepID=A0A016X186_9BILA|nr:hypothetical protein Y032_0420g1144 [Ancylostoma ceylanicum]
MNKNYQKAYSVCSSDEERAFVNNGWFVDIVQIIHDRVYRWFRKENDVGIRGTHIVCLKNPYLMLHRPSAEPRRTPHDNAWVTYRGSADSRCCVRQGFFGATVRLISAIPTLL